ncbi:MAG: hypothetical protein IKQ22_00875 [Clostridia bacterium]|nr:hypothetical protein [Clostridia bacterium]
MDKVVMDPHDLQLQKLGFTIDHLKASLLKCANENAGKHYCTGNIVVPNICKDTVIAIDYLLKELEKEKKLNEEIKIRFVKCNICTPDMKDKCLMFNESLCEGERCEELVDLMSLVEKRDTDDKLVKAKELLESCICKSAGSISPSWSDPKDADKRITINEEGQHIVVRKYGDNEWHSPTEDYCFKEIEK